VNAFHVIGGITAIWAVVVSVLGFRRPDFPGSRGGERIVIAISAVLVVASIAAGVITAATEEHEGEGEHGEESALIRGR
jgi:hypothetical protein